MDSPGTMPTRCFMVIMCGIPASGKSLYASIMHKYPQLWQHAFETVVHDQPFNCDIQLVSFDSILHHSLEAAGNKFTSELWHQCRLTAIQQIETWLSTSPERAPQVNMERARIIVVDDNMNYRSMRRKIIELALKHCANFVQLSILSPLSLCLKRNETRTGLARVDPDTIRNMPFECPGTSDSWWDVHALSINNTDTKEDESDIVAMVPWNDLASLLLLAPLPSIPRSTQENLLNEQSIIHKVDLACRKCISSVMSDSNLTRSFSKQISVFKQDFVKSSKSGLALMTVDGPLQQDYEAQLVATLANEFENRLSLLIIDLLRYEYNSTDQ